MSSGHDRIETEEGVKLPGVKTKHLRACLLCSLVMAGTDFRAKGCPNCEEILQLRNSPDRISTCTTAYFDGIIANINPESSWVAKWQRTGNYAKGIYAVRVKGRIPEDVEADLDARGIKYRPRDQTEVD
ncbi:transcription elongation factor spt4 [Marasmius sp. AFHP31]|uniref:Transcription elongation factor SPT4 n=1 Tax=Marasmius tenuissimus TaxID=585030 RepID=A0ABR2ZXJ0_9AGAR|nr:transcription elongation factor spt4 [Marasmius tenuissimus]KAK1234141.1 transcription elongation factor spt4 [Marasmius sp. AFHP31]KAK1236253.1 transcription elongation factor spt4 [Marasmius sp. AFHP31]